MDNRKFNETFKILEDAKISIPINVILSKLDHPNREVRAKIIRNLRNVPLKDLDSELISKLIPYMNDPTGSVRSSVFEIFAKIGNFKKNSIPVKPIFEGLVDLDKNVRNSAVLALKEYFNENPKALDIDMIINKIDPNNTNILISVLNLLGDLWEKNPEKILTILLIFIKFENKELKTEISRILAKNYLINPELIFNNLIKLKDESKFISKGIISSTLIEIARKNSEIIIPKLINCLQSEDEDTILNALVTLEGLIEDHLNQLNIRAIVPILQKSYNLEIKKQTSQLISKIAKEDPLSLKPIINNLFEIQSKLDYSVRVILTKSILEIAKKEPDLIPVGTIINLFADNDSFIREISTKILGFIGYKVPLEVVNLLLNKALKDDEWIVRDAAISSLGNIIENVDEKQKIIEKLVSLMDDKNSWVRKSAMNLISSIEKIDPALVPIEFLLKNLNHSDYKVRQGATNLLQIYDFTVIDNNFEKIIIALGDEAEEVRRTMINTLVQFIQQVGLSKIISKLLKNLSDSSSLSTQQSIALIFQRTAKYEDEKIKKRIIALLKVRCEMSQDPIICEALTKIKEG